MDHFTLHLRFDVPAERLYEAITAADRWWTRHGTLSGGVGDVLDFRFPRADFFARMKIRALEPPRLIEWDCVDAKHPEHSGWADLRDWVGTRVRFRVEPDGPSAARLRFEHVGLSPVLECHDACASAWAYYLNDSLRALVETGEGKPYDDATFDPASAGA